MEPDKKEPRYRGRNLSVDAAGDDLADLSTRAQGADMSPTVSSDAGEHASQRLGPTGIRAQLRQVAVNAVHQVNAQLLDILCVSARSTTPRSPFKDPLRARFTRLSASQCERLACCGTLLVDVGFSDPGRWRNAAESSEKSPVQLPPQLDQWLLPDEAILLAHSTLLVAWSVLHGARSEAGVLLGTPPETAGIVAGMTVNQLSYIAQRYAAWVRPRWMEAPKIWSGLLDFAADGSPDRSRFAVLRCWQLNGGHASWLESYFAARRWSCKR